MGFGKEEFEEVNGRYSEIERKVILLQLEARQAGFEMIVHAFDMNTGTSYHHIDNELMPQEFLIHMAEFYKNIEDKLNSAKRLIDGK